MLKRIKIGSCDGTVHTAMGATAMVHGRRHRRHGVAEEHGDLLGRGVESWVKLSSWLGLHHWFG